MGEKSCFGITFFLKNVTRLPRLFRIGDLKCDYFKMYKSALYFGSNSDSSSKGSKIICQKQKQFNGAKQSIKQTKN